MDWPAPQFELRQLRYFVVLADELHFGRAAQRLNIAQPPLSQQIQRLERITGQLLFERKPKVRLTPAGEAFLASARSVLQQVAQGVERTQRVGQGLEGRLTIGFAASVLLTCVPKALRLFREKFPDVELTLRELSSAAQMASLRDGSVDVGVLREAPENVSDLECRKLTTETFVAVLPPGHPLQSRTAIELYELRDEPFVLFPRAVAPSLHGRVHRLFAEAGFDPRLALEAQEWLTIVGLVESGAGVSLVPSSFRRLRWGDVSYVELAAPHVETSIFVCRRARANNSAATHFVGMLSDVAAQSQ